MRSVSVLNMIEIDLPVENKDDPMLLQARGVEAMQVLQRFKNCKSARAATSGVFNVKIGKPFDADASKLPKELRSALEKKNIVGPSRSATGIQLLALCSKRVMAPPRPKLPELPSRQQVETMLKNQRGSQAEEKVIANYRRLAVIDYRDPAYRPSN